MIVSEGQPDRRMQEWSPVQVSASTPKLLAHHALSFFGHFCHQRLHAALLVQRAFALRDDHFGPAFFGGERLDKGVAHCRHVVGAA